MKRGVADSKLVEDRVKFGELLFYGGTWTPCTYDIERVGETEHRQRVNNMGGKGG